jgi:hypothetical protein
MKLHAGACLPLLTLTLLACSPGASVDIAASRADAAATAVDATATPGADQGGSTADAVVPTGDAVVRPAADRGVSPGADARPATDDAATPASDAATTPEADARVPGADANTTPGADANTMPVADALPPPADAFVHVLPDSLRPDALPLEDRLAACDADPLLADVVADNEGWGHVPAGTEVNYTHNPPGSGPHYGQWTRSGVYAEAIDRRNWVHNLEHGWLVLLYRPGAPAADVRVLTDAWAAGFPDEQCPDSPVHRIIVTPDPLLPTPVAAITAFRVLAGDHVTTDQLAHMFASCRVGAPELRACGDGQVPAAPPSMLP